MGDDNATLTLSDNVLSVLSQNPGVTFTPAQLRLVTAGTVVVKRGCVTRLVYGKNAKDLVFAQLDPGGSINASNFADFRELFEAAAAHGYEMLFCYNTQTRAISMPHLLPCRCKCKKRR